MPATTKKKITTTPTVSTTAAITASTLSLVDAPPTDAIQAPPVGFAPGNMVEFRGFYPNATQVAMAPLVAQELSSSTDYVERFGPNAPAAVACANSVDLAVRWRATRTAVELLYAYVREEDALAWKEALTPLRQLEPLFEAAVTHDPTVASAYPGLARFFAAPKVIAKSAAATKKRAAKEKAAATAGTTAPTVGKGVTVSG